MAALVTVASLVGSGASAATAPRPTPPDTGFAAAALYSGDPLFDQQWALKAISAPAAWSVTRGSKDVVVAVVDSGIAADHPDLTGNIWTNPGESGGGRESNGHDDDGNGYADDWRGWDWIDDDNRPADLSGHGTHSAGVIGARGNDGTGMTGINWEVSLMPLRALDGADHGSAPDVAAAFRYAGRMGADIVNASFSGAGFSQDVLSAIQGAPDTLFVVAAGNEQADNDSTPAYPCNYSAANVVCVAASNQKGALTDFSNYGPSTVDLAAPGTTILGPTPALATPLFEEFERGLGSWSIGGTGTQWGLGSDEYGGFVTTSAYDNGTSSWIQLELPASLAGQSDCGLSYYTRAHLASGDVLVVEATSGTGPWVEIGRRRGDTGDWWTKLSHNLTRWAGAESVRVRFRLEADSSGTDGGVDIDDVTIECASSVYTGEEYTSAGGTSEAAPHVAGAAALLKAYAPELGPAEIKSALLSGVTRDFPFEGMVASGGRLDIMGALEVLGAQQVIPEDRIHTRSITLARTKTGLAGALRVADGTSSCLGSMQVLIKRNGSIVKRAETTDSGRFKIPMRVRAGRYVAVAPETRVGLDRADVCSKATSNTLKV